MNNNTSNIFGLETLLEDIQNHKYNAAIFDIDGTLIDSMPIWEDLDADFLKTQGIELSEQEKQELNATMWSMTVDEGIRYLKETYQLELSEEAIGKALSDVVEQFYTDEVPAKQDVAGLVEALHDAGVPMALATVGEPSYETAALKRLGLLDYFESMCDCNSLGTTKRDAFIYETAAKLLLGSERGGEPAAASEPAGESGPAESNAAVLVIEDVLHALEAAKQAGFTTVAVEDDASAKDKPRILEVSDFYIKKDQ
ncbi:MAG: HAD family phosphatase [Clostridia bacterium]|nr:HAD family phosphatase [Clostridia bacterium]MBQ8925494.1 HAD family phosphatase [Clostridia bacterium]